jgi:hypothetical protein
MSVSVSCPTPARCGIIGMTMLAMAAACPAKAESGDGSNAAYASLPSDLTTGSLPGATTRVVKTSTGFTAAVEHGSVLLRATTPTGCLPGDLKSVVADLSVRFGRVSLESTHRSRGHNWRAGGARQSLHLSCRAIDFRVRTGSRGVLAYLRTRPEVGGLKIYRNGIIHIDNGERRSW